MKYTKEELDHQLEDIIGDLYKVLFRMRESGFIQEEYDSMGTLIRMLTEDRQHLRRNHTISY